VIRPAGEVAAAGAPGRDPERFAYATLDALSEHVAVLDEGGTVVATNRAWREFAGANSPSLEGLCEGANYLDACASASGVGEADAARFAEGLRAVIGGGLDEFSLEYPCHSPTERRWFIARATRFEFGGGVRAVVTHANITDRKRAEEAIRFQSHLLDTVEQAVIATDLGGTITYWNHFAEKLYGWAAAEIIGRNIMEVVLPRGARERAAEVLSRLQAGQSWSGEFTVRRRDGTTFRAFITDTPIHDTEGATVGIVGVSRDITERKRTESALRQSEGKYRLLLEQASDGIHTYDPRGNFIETNTKLCEMLGYTREELLRLNVGDIIPPEDLARAPLRFDDLRAGRTLLTERRLLRKDGTLLPVEISGRMIQDGVLQSIVRDISERKRAEEELHKAYDELERRVGERTAELARANATLKAEAAERLRAEEARRELLRRLVSAQEEERRRISRELHDQMGQQLAALMMGLKTLGADSHGRRSALHTLRQLQELTDQLAREVHTLAWGLRPPALDDLGLHTALCNYVEEWAERSRVPVDFHSAGFEGVRLPLSHETALYRIAQEALTNVFKHSGADRVSFILERRGDHVLAVVEDNGKGFDVEAPPETSDRGRKLGLLGMRERAALLGGTLDVESAHGAGTTVFVRIPLAAGGDEGGGARG
jgi:PAS domain S-box-containing protein